jgi:hypothetical protein
VSFRDLPSFDVLTGAAEPFDGGDVSVTPQILPRFEEVVSQAAARVVDIFAVDVPANLDGAAELERIVIEMWDDGWNPDEGEVSLFVRDFGALLVRSILGELNGVPVFRSPTDLSHMSVWWPDLKVETFPFHRMYKRMTHADGESITYYISSLNRLVKR